LRLHAKVTHGDIRLRGGLMQGVDGAFIEIQYLYGAKDSAREGVVKERCPIEVGVRMQLLQSIAQGGEFKGTRFQDGSIRLI